jgi:hypothetical protein
MPLSTVLHSLSEKLGPSAGQGGMKTFLYAAQIGLGVGFILLVLRLRGGSKSGFAVREADLKKNPKSKIPGPDLASARMERKVPLALEGISLGGPPHELLGVAVGASEEEIQRAYRERMKRFHPDKVGRPGSREWNDAQQIAHAINDAKDELLKRARARK